MQAEAWIADRDTTASGDETEYVAASVAMRREEQTVAHRRRRLGFAVVGAGLITVGILGGLALVQRRQAVRDESLTTVHNLANEAMVVVDDDPELAALLGLESAEQAITLGIEPPVETIAALNNAVQA